MADTDQAQQPNELEAEQRQAEARERAQQLWHDAESATDDHPYLQSKGVAAHGLKVFHGQLAIGGVSCDGALLVKIRDCAGTIHSVGFITASRQKVHLPGGRKSGCFFSIGGRTDLIVIGRRFTVAASCHEATGYAAAVAFGPGNAIEVARALRAKYPLARIVVAADNDGAANRNLGIEAARIAAAAVNGFVAVPHLDGRACDFNDLALEQGLGAVRLAIETAQPPEQAAFDTKLESHAAIEDSYSAEQSSDTAAAPGLAGEDAADERSDAPQAATEPLEGRPSQAPASCRTSENALLGPDSEESQLLLKFIARKRLAELSRKHALQYGPNAIRYAPLAKMALRGLVRTGWLSTEDDSHYRLTPAACVALGVATNSGTVAE